ncbi:MHYT domain-containing protein [Streptomyces koyangensis]|uniref:MHYT domain-containing protein n=1 Tax=Streptomyces koyangensis TaxID=188770 RepID=A0ABX7EAV0_9ACTN|nr:MHYT domain-containing protein [Streptomyces koyangensis]QRF01662.1 hypothetical protein G9U55_05220 [Streptomyces koyangensis]
MQGTVDGFSYGLVTPVAAYLMACLGGALGLRCTTRSLLVTRTWRPGWLALGTGAIGSGIWTMHFIAMMGFSVTGTPVRYDVPTTFASLGVAIVMVGIGIFVVGYRGATGSALFTGGTITGLGIASMHYLGMAGMRLNGSLEYSIPLVTASVLIAVAAATASLWAAVQVRGFRWSVGASLLMGVGVSGMHYVGMAAATVHLHPVADTAGDPPGRLIAPLMIGPLLFLLLAGVVVVLDPRMVSGAVAPGPPPPPGYRVPVRDSYRLPPAEDHRAVPCPRSERPARASRDHRAARPPARPGARRRTGPPAGQRR